MYKNIRLSTIFILPAFPFLIYHLYTNVVNDDMPNGIPRDPFGIDSFPSAGKKGDLQNVRKYERGRELPKSKGDIFSRFHPGSLMFYFILLNHNTQKVNSYIPIYIPSEDERVSGLTYA